MNYKQRERKKSGPRFQASMSKAGPMTGFGYACVSFLNKVLKSSMLVRTHDDGGAQNSQNEHRFQNTNCDRK